MLKIVQALVLLLLLSGNANAAARFLVACTTACTWDASTTAIWSTTSGGAGGSTVPGVNDAVTLDANTCTAGLACTITVNGDVSVQSITMGACTAATTGCILDFSANNNNVNLSAGGGFSGSGTGTRTLNLGNGTWTLSGAAATWTMATTTSLTFNANSSTVSFTGNSTISQNRTFSGGALTYNVVSFGTATGSSLIVGTNTFATLNMTFPIAVSFPSATTQTITNAFTWSGSTSSIGYFYATTVTGAATISVASGAPSIAFAGIRALTFTGGATFAATNSFNLGGNTGITITPPSGGKIIGGWLFGNDNQPMFLNKAA